MYTRKSTMAAVKRQHKMEQANTFKTTKISPPRITAGENLFDFCFKKYCYTASLMLVARLEKKKRKCSA